MRYLIGRHKGNRGRSDAFCMFHDLRNTSMAGRTLGHSLVRWCEATHQTFLRSINLNAPVNVGMLGDAGWVDSFPASSDITTVCHVARFFSLKTAVLRQQCAEKLPVLHSNPPKIRRQNSIRLNVPYTFCAIRSYEFYYPLNFTLFKLTKFLSVLVIYLPRFTLYLHFFFQILLVITCRSYGGIGIIVLWR